MVKVLLVMCLGASAALAGETPIKVGKPVSVGGEAVSVKFRPYTAKIGPDEGVVLKGQVLSRLPHKFFKVQITIRMWDVYRERNDLFERGRADVTFDSLVPSVPKRWQAVLVSPHKEGLIEPFAHPDPIYTVIVQFVKHVPGVKEAED